MNIRAELKSLKENYEQSLQQYERTKKTQYYLIYQNGFRDYLSFIEQHRLRTCDVDKLVYSELPKASEEKESQTKTSSQKKITSGEVRALRQQQKIMDFILAHKRCVETKEIADMCGLGLIQARRYLERLKSGGRLEKQRFLKDRQTCYVWSPTQADS